MRYDTKARSDAVAGNKPIEGRCLE